MKKSVYPFLMISFANKRSKTRLEIGLVNRGKSCGGNDELLEHDLRNPFHISFIPNPSYVPMIYVHSIVKRFEIYGIICRNSN